MDCVRSRVEQGVMSACLLIDGFRIGRQLVPETVEIDSLTTGNEALFVGSSEIEVPDLRTANNVFPVPDAGERCIDDDPAGDMRWVLRRQRVADAVAAILDMELG